LFKAGQSVLDVGVSDASRKRLPGVNYFLKNYRFDPGTYTGLGVQDLSGLQKLFPGKRFVQYPGGTFPFADKEFDWVFSNAVVEHVGDDEARLIFVNEMMRVAKHVFFTTPNKYFPVDAHSNAIFLHWNERLFYRWCEKNKPSITRHRMRLLSFRDLTTLLEHSRASRYVVHKNRVLGVPMTFTVICSGEQDAGGQDSLDLFQRPTLFRRLR
jgi:hypothetical protein